MAQLKDSLIAGDLRVTGTMYGAANLTSLNASGTGLGTNGQILTSTGTGLAWSSSVAPSSHTHGNITNTGALGAANAAVVTDGDKKITTRTIKNMTAAGNLGWTAAATDIYIPTVNTLAYWNGRYNSSNSNLEYCKKGAFGDLAIKSSIGNHTYVKATGTSRSTDVALDSTTVNSITAVGTLPSLTITSTTVVTGGSTTNIPNISKKTVVTDATAAKATYANGILSISDGSVTKGDSVGVGTAIAAYTSLTSGSVGSASNWSAGTLPTKGSNTTVATTVKTQPTFSITTENATLSHTIS